jgi:aerobic carbon-monoxide dehydrogenase medium subunit
MKPPAFQYASPTTIPDAVALLTEHAGDDVRVLAGGQSLVPLMNFRLAHPGFLVDLRRVAGLDAMRVDGHVLVIGAMVRQATAERSAEVALGAPLLAEALGHVAHPPIRNSGTVVGSIAHADPAAELPAVALAMDAEMTAVGPQGERRIPAADFFQGPFTTALGADEILTEVRLPRFPGGHAFVEFSRTHGNFAVVGVAALVAVTGGRVTRAALAASGVGPGGGRPGRRGDRRGRGRRDRRPGTDRRPAGEPGHPAGHRPGRPAQRHRARRRARPGPEVSRTCRTCTRSR